LNSGITSIGHDVVDAVMTMSWKPLKWQMIVNAC